MRLLLLCLPLLLLYATDACAWGAGVHLSLGLKLLDNLSILPQLLQTLLAAYPDDFLYGCIAADITLGKKHTHHLEHCHNWSIGLRILENARQQSETAEACAYGYLAHLGADIIAHNLFVPYKLAMSYNTTLLNHAYWEIRADGGIKRSTWQHAQRLAKRDNSQLDQLLSQSIADTLFSFRTNKQIFNSMMLISRLRRWRTLIRSMAKRSKWEFEISELQEYMAMSYTIIGSVLMSEESPYWNSDPIGERALTAASLIRKNLNLLWLDGKLRDEDAMLILANLHERLEAGITDPDQILPLISVL